MQLSRYNVPFLALATASGLRALERTQSLPDGTHSPGLVSGEGGMAGYTDGVTWPTYGVVALQPRDSLRGKWRRLG